MGNRGGKQAEDKNGETKKTGGIGHAMFIIDNKGDIGDFYHINSRRIGEGSFARICKCHNKSTGAARAVKITRKSSSKRKNDLTWYEISIMKMLDHPNILKIFEHFESSKYIYAVIELCQGSEIHDLVVENGHFAEDQAAHVMNQIFRAVFYMHTSHICHRDLKPENIMLSRKEDLVQSTVKLIDFGHARVFQKGVMMTTKCGATYYVSPQILAGRYDQSTDMWTCGVLLYIFICGYPPFAGGNDAEILSKVRLGNYTFAASDWKHITPACKDLVRGLMKINPKDRTKAKEAMLSEWVDDFVKKKTVTMNLRVVESFRKFRSMNMLKKASLHLIAGQIDEEVIKPLREIFVSLDWSGDGLVSASELRMGLRKAGVKMVPEDLDELMQDIDTDGSGEIDYSEFLAATLDPAVYTKEEVCWSAFRVFDRDGDGVVTWEELRNALNNGSPEDIVTDELAKDMVKEVDENGDETIHFTEFVKMMKGLCQPFVNKTEKQRAKEEKKRKRKEGKLKIEQATKAAQETNNRKTFKDGLNDIMRGFGRTKSGRGVTQIIGHPGVRKSMHNTRHNILEEIGNETMDADGAYGMENRDQFDGNRKKSRVTRMKSRAHARMSRAQRHAPEEVVEIDRHVGLNVWIKSAKVKGPETLDLWVICEKPGSEERFQTEEISDSNEPEWNFIGHIFHFTETDELNFTMMDHPMAPPVGKCSLQADDFIPTKGFSGDIKLKDKNKGVGYLTVEIEVVDLQALAATKVQAMFRGKAARGMVQEMREDRENAATYDTEEAEKASGGSNNFDIGDEGGRTALETGGPGIRTSLVQR